MIVARGSDVAKLVLATLADVDDLVVVRNAAAERLTAEHGTGVWSGMTSDRGVRYSMKIARVYLARVRGQAAATLTLSTRKPWAIDRAYFTPCPRPLYLLNMAVHPKHQRRGLGGRCLEDAKELARAYPAQAIWLDAFDAPAGAGPFYAKCGFRGVGRATYRGAPLLYYEWRVPPSS